MRQKLLAALIKHCTFTWFRCSEHFNDVRKTFLKKSFFLISNKYYQDLKNQINTESRQKILQKKNDVPDFTFLYFYCDPLLRHYQFFVTTVVI